MPTEVEITEADSLLTFRNTIENEHQKVLEVTRKNAIEIMFPISSWVDDPRIAEHSQVMTHCRLAELQ